MPEEFSILNKCSERGIWSNQNFSSPKSTGFERGIFMNRITLWKLNPRLHRDWNDFLCMVTCGGKFEGGEFLVPELGLKFKCVIVFVYLESLN